MHKLKSLESVEREGGGEVKGRQDSGTKHCGKQCLDTLGVR